MKVSDLITRARLLLNDEDLNQYRWQDSELIAWTNDAQRAVATLRPDSCPDTKVVALAAGTKQTIPSDNFRLLDVIRNVEADDVTPGRSINIIDRDTLDRFDPYWHKAKAKPEARHFTYDERTPTVYFVYPPAVGGTKVEAVFSKYPDKVEDLEDDLELAETYFDATLNYVLFRAYSKDTEFTSNPQVAGAYLASFNNMMGIKTLKTNAFSPVMNRKGDAPNAGAAQMGGVV
jgi:hypothetical protein